MELNENIKKDLKCSNCDNYLTCTPIMVRPNGESICGRCSPLREEKHLVVRNNAFEKLASVITFPCRYQIEGCNFSSLIAELEEHELYCEHLKFNCPILPSGSCPWIGSRLQILEHFQADHIDLFLQHPCNVKPNITRNCENNMLTSFAGKLFLVQIKYNFSSNKIWHNVRLMDNTKLTKHYEYNFEILSERGNVLKKCDVLDQKSFQIYNDQQKEIDVNSLISFLGRFDDLIFQIAIIEKEHLIPCDNCKINRLAADATGAICVDCSKITVVDNNLGSNYKCNKLEDGCLYYDNYINVKKHEIWFCEFAQNICTLCHSKVTDLFNHYFNTHKGALHFDVMRKENMNLNIKYNATLVFNDVIFLCSWNFTRSYLEFKIISNTSKTENDKYDCILKISNPKDKFQKIYKLMHDKDNVTYDWLANIKPDSDNPIIGLISERGIVYNRYNFELTMAMKTSPYI